jgi:hypothetical protein
MDAKELNTPIICSVSDITPIEMRDNSRAAARLRELAETNHTARQQAVSGLVRLASGGRRVRANENRRKAHG